MLCVINFYKESIMSFKLTALAFTSLLVVNLAAAQTAAPAAPKAPEPEYTLSYNLGAVTDYRFRGISQTSKKPALQGGVDFAHKSGLYLGAWASNVNWVRTFNGANKSNLELDWYGGYKTEVAKNTTLDLGLISYQYPGNNSGAAGTVGGGAFSNANTTEIYGGLTYGIYTAKYNRSTGDFLGNLRSKGSNYIDLSAAVDIGNGITVTPHIGRQVVANTVAANYTDYSVTLAKDLGGGLTVSGALTGTTSRNPGFYVDNSGKFIASNAFVLGAKYSF